MKNTKLSPWWGLTLTVWIVGCGSHPAQNPKPEPTPSSDGTAQVHESIPGMDNIRVEILDSPVLPVDIAAHPNFATQGFIIARERYTNLNDHSVSLIAAPTESSLILQSQIETSFSGGSDVNTSTSMPIQVAVTSPIGDFDVERISHSVLGNPVEIPAGAQLILNWRVSPASSLPLCLIHLGQTMLNHTALWSSAGVGSSITGSLQRTVSFADDSSAVHGDLFSDSVPNQSSGTVNTTPNTFGSSGNCIWFDYVNSSPQTYDVDLRMDDI